MEQVEQIRDMPDEVWKEILLKLWLNEEDLEHVLICRLVCRLWKKLVEEMPPKPYWNPWLKHTMDGYRTVHHSFATMINSDSSIRELLSGNFESEKNPFRNHTLSVFLHGVKEEEKTLLKVIENHGEHVWKFLYQPDEDVPEALTNFPQLLTHMKNIRTLVLDCVYLSKKQLMAIDGINFPRNLNQLNELVLMDQCGYDDKMYAKLLVNYGSQIKSLTLDTWSLHLNRSKIMERLPNLEDLRIECRSIDLEVVVPPAAKQWPKLKRLTLANPCSWWGPTPVRCMFKVAGCFAETLQLLSLGASLEMKKAVFDSSQNNDAVVITTFPKLTQLIIPLWFMCDQGQSTNIPLEAFIRFSMPNLKLLILEDTYDDLKNWYIGEAELEEICAPLWPLVPSSVETIAVRIRKVNRVLDQVFPVVYKCKRH